MDAWSRDSYTGDPTSDSHIDHCYISGFNCVNGTETTSHVNIIGPFKTLTYYETSITNTVVNCPTNGPYDLADGAEYVNNVYVIWKPVSGYPGEGIWKKDGSLNSITATSKSFTSFEDLSEWYVPYNIDFNEGVAYLREFLDLDPWCFEAGENGRIVVTNFHTTRNCFYVLIFKFFSILI